MRPQSRRRRAVRLRLRDVSGVGSRPLRVALVAGEHSGDQLGFKLMRALRERRRETSSSRRRRRGDGGGGPQEPVSDQRHRGNGNPAGARSPAEASSRASGRRRNRSSPRSRTRSSSSTAPTSPIASPAACARRCRTCRSSTTSARASGRGGRGGRKRCAPMSIACSASCPSSPRPTFASGARAASMSAIR